jgi:prepilin-type N-terminal cleavage/methylation domain-containing protein
MTPRTAVEGRKTAMKTTGIERGRRCAFTLIELLVVISIIALLMAILMPAMTRARKQAKAVTCQMNLKQWCTVFSMYTADHGGKFPGDCDIEHGWLTVAKPYYKDEKLLLCPTATKPWQEGGTQPFASWLDLS